MFGKKIELNFNENESSHKNTIGGIMSVIFYFVMIFYTEKCLQSMLSRSDSSYSSLKIGMNPEELGEVFINDTGLLF